MRTNLLLKATLAIATMLLASGPVLANVYDIYFNELAANPNVDVVKYTVYTARPYGFLANETSDTHPSPNFVYYYGSRVFGGSADTYLSIPAALITVPVNEILTASFNYDALVVQKAYSGSDILATFSGGGSVLASNGTGWQSFDITNGLKNSLATSPATIDYNFYHVADDSSFFVFSSAYVGAAGLFNDDGVPKPSFIRITTADVISGVPEPETYALMLAGLGLIGAVARRRKITNI